MTGRDHCRVAEELLTGRGVLDDLLIGMAQVNATLALALVMPREDLTQAFRS